LQQCRQGVYQLVLSLAELLKVHIRGRGCDRGAVEATSLQHSQHMHNMAARFLSMQPCCIT
jgi:hypothetical protein